MFQVVSYHIIIFYYATFQLNSYKALSNIIASYIVGLYSTTKYFSSTLNIMIILFYRIVYMNFVFESVITLRIVYYRKHNKIYTALNGIFDSKSRKLSENLQKFAILTNISTNRMTKININYQRGITKNSFYFPFSNVLLSRIQ